METHYSVLGIAVDASAADITKAYRRLAMKYHPDRNPDDAKQEATRKFHRAKAAYEVLSDPPARIRYDEDLRTAGRERREAAGRSAAGQTGFDAQWADLARDLSRSGMTRDTLSRTLVARGCPQEQARQIAHLAVLQRDGWQGARVRGRRRVEAARKRGASSGVRRGRRRWTRTLLRLWHALLRSRRSYVMAGGLAVLAVCAGIVDATWSGGEGTALAGKVYAGAKPADANSQTSVASDVPVAAAAQSAPVVLRESHSVAGRGRAAADQAASNAGAALRSIEDAVIGKPGHAAAEHDGAAASPGRAAHTPGAQAEDPGGAQEGDPASRLSPVPAAAPLTAYTVMTAFVPGGEHGADVQRFVPDLLGGITVAPPRAESSAASHSGKLPLPAASAVARPASAAAAAVSAAAVLPAAMSPAPVVVPGAERVVALRVGNQTGALIWRRLPAGAAFDAARARLDAPFIARLLARRVLDARTRTMLYLYAAVPLGGAFDCDRCRPVLAAAIARKGAAGDTVTMPLTVLAASGARGQLDTRELRPDLMNFGNDAHALALRDVVTSDDGGIVEQAVFYRVDARHLARIGALRVRVDATATGACQSRHAFRDVREMCENWISTWRLADSHDPVMRLSVHTRGTGWLMPSHTPFPIDDDRIVTADAKGRLVEQAVVSPAGPRPPALVADAR
jgi:hypothetical protein